MGRGLWSLVELSLDGAANVFRLDYNVTRSCLWTIRVAAAVLRRRLLVSALVVMPLIKFHSADCVRCTLT